MAEKYQFYGQTTFIDRPVNTVIKDFQNTYVQNSGEKREILQQLQTLIELLLRSTDLSQADKQEAVTAVHDVAGQIKEKKGTKLSWRGTLSAVREAAAGAADIAKPVAELVSVISGLL